MEEGRIYKMLKKYREENQTAIKDMRFSLEATVSHFNKAISRMVAANDAFVSETSDHIIDLDVRLSKLEKRS